MAQHLVLAGEDIEPWPPCKAAPLMLKMSEPGRGQDQRRSIAAHRVGKPNTICSHAEADALVHGSKRCRAGRTLRPASEWRTLSFAVDGYGEVP